MYVRYSDAPIDLLRKEAGRRFLKPS